ncbi:MAG: hypothetical protein ACREQ5_27785 [Candidatus Dormibacteria bacterium]
MKRCPTGAAGLGAALLLAGCGGGGQQTMTAQISSGGARASVVVTSDGDAITKLKQDKSIGSGGVSVADGDHHSGSLVCQVDVNSSAHKYHIAVYGDYPKDLCNASSFSSGLP